MLKCDLPHPLTSVKFVYGTSHKTEECTRPVCLLPFLLRKKKKRFYTNVTVKY